jgi:hypothetical protein
MNTLSLFVTVTNTKNIQNERTGIETVTYMQLGNYNYQCPYRLLVGNPEGKRPLGRPRHMWIDNIKMDLLEIELNVVDWIGLAQDRYRWRALVNSIMNLRVP